MTQEDIAEESETADSPAPPSEGQKSGRASSAGAASVHETPDEQTGDIADEKGDPEKLGEVDADADGGDATGDDAGATTDEAGEGAGDAEGHDAGDTTGDGEAIENEEELSTGLTSIKEEVEILNQELSSIKISVPQNEFHKHIESFSPEDFPLSYRENNSREKVALAFAENFRRQYVHLYRDRKPLLLNPKNECDTEKFICTTLYPTKLPYRELYNWDGAASFVSDYLNSVLLDPPTEIPERVVAPATTLQIQKGNSFEYSMLLCSLLIGAGYDAYVVSGYATRECCLMDETREICPLLVKKAEEQKEEVKESPKKYAVRPPKDLRSKFELKQEERKVKAAKEAEEKQKREAERKELETERPSSDPLFGLRVHSWVLVLAGKREVPESFFIESLTGESQLLETDMYLGIESLWNDVNYWVNMQDCSEGVRKLSYDLGDCTLWEFMFPSNDKPILALPEVDEALADEDEDDEKVDDIEKHFDIPPSWTKPIVVSRGDYETRCPLGKKTKIYKRSKLEKFAPYLLQDGLTTKLSIYADRECADVTEIREYFSNRMDRLKLRTHNQTTGRVHEFFEPGRHAQLKEHTYMSATPGPESERLMLFYNEARVDGLAKRKEGQLEMTEHFVDRPDRLYYRHVIFGKRVKKFGPADASSNSARPIVRIIEKFHRHTGSDAPPANDDVAERVFLCAEDRIQLTYHTDNDKVSASTREFVKPPQSDEKAAGAIVMQPDMHLTFQVDPSSRQKREVEVYQMLLDLLALEEFSKEAVRLSEHETRDILDTRGREEASSELDISLFDTERNERAKKHREELERQLEDERLRRQEKELDYLAPFLEQMAPHEGGFSKEQVFKLREDCLQDFKQRLIDKANLIQARFEKETQELQKKQQWYQQNQVQMSKEDEEDYLSYCSEAMFRIQILEQMLNRHKQTAPHKYMDLEKKLRSDPRLVEHLLAA